MYANVRERATLAVMARDLSDREVARELGKHPRTIQRWCLAGDLPGARKVGCRWRIPAADVRATRVGEDGGADDVERELRAARVVCEQLRQEMEVAIDRRAPVERNWRSIARELEKLHQGLGGLPSRPDEVPSFLAAQPTRARASRR